MKFLILILSTALSALLASLCAVRAAEDQKSNVKSYTLNTCAVCGMKLGDMGKPYTFTYKDREIKVCDKEEAKDFKKDATKYLKKIEEAEAKAKK